MRNNTPKCVILTVHLYSYCIYIASKPFYAAYHLVISYRDFDKLYYFNFKGSRIKEITGCDSLNRTYMNSLI